MVDKGDHFVITHMLMRGMQLQAKSASLYLQPRLTLDLVLQLLPSMGISWGESTSTDTQEVAATLV